MAYKSKTKLRGRIMKQIRRKVSKVTRSQNTQIDKLRLLSKYQYTQFETTQAFLNTQEPPKPKKKKGLKLRIRVAVQRPKRRRLNFPTVTILGTPEGETITKEVQAKESKKEEGIGDDLDLYYKVYNRYKPEAGESNAESVARTTAFEAEYQYLLVKKKKKQEMKEKATKLHSLSPITPTRETLEFQVTTEASQKGHSSNNVQEISIETDYSLYPSQDKPIQNQTINIIYDTGAAISMLPAEYTHAWTNVRECLHTLTGCFAGHSETNLMIGEFHGIMTLDSQETIRIVIPE
jgi:hypothetical protein